MESGTRGKETIVQFAASGAKAGLRSGAPSSILYALFVYKTAFSAVVNALYAYYASSYAYLPTTILSQFQFAVLGFLLLVGAPILVGIIVGPMAAILFFASGLRQRKRGTRAVLALLAFWAAQGLYGYFLLSSVFGPGFLGPWTLVSLVTGLPFAYLHARPSAAT